MRVYVTRRLPGDAHERIRETASVLVWPEDRPVPRDVLLDAVSQADGLLCLLTETIDEELFEAGASLRVVSQMAVGVDNIDLEAASRRGIPVGHTPGVLTETTADLAWALILAVARRVTEAERFLRAGRWRDWGPALLLGRDVHGATLGIVGMGAVGRAVAARAAGFGMRVVYASRSEAPGVGAERMELDELLAEADFVTLHVALTDETRNLIDARRLQLMKPSAYLVNTSRGGVVDEVALVEALASRSIAGAALDVYATEPLPGDSPLPALDNVVLVPHIGSASVATRTRMAHLAVDNLLAGLQGRPLAHRANA